MSAGESRKASEIRRRQGFYRPRRRTKPTTGNLGPRDPGPHGKTLEQTHRLSTGAFLRSLSSWKPQP